MRSGGLSLYCGPRAPDPEAPPVVPYRIPRLTLLLAGVLQAGAFQLGLDARLAHARVVTGISAEHHVGQTFVRWQDLGPGWRYRVYRSTSPIGDAQSLAYARLLGMVGDSSAVDSRRTAILGSLQTFRIDSSAAPLPVGSGLFVHTPGTAAIAHYAVLAESSAIIFDSTLTAGQNRTVTGVAESPQMPLPVWQRKTASPANGDDYVLWVQSTPTSTMPALSNLPSIPTHLSLVRGVPGRPLTVFGHSRGGNSYNGLLGSGYPGESILCVEDHMPTRDVGGFTFGHHLEYDRGIFQNDVPNAGMLVADYVDRRMLYILDWAERALGHDPARVFLYGGSMGGSLAFFFAFHHPERIAASVGVIPKLCTGYTPDSNDWLRASFDRIWGRLADAPMGTNGVPVYEWMDGRSLAVRQRIVGTAPYSLFFGRADTVVGWPEKVAYAEAMQTNRIGGALFWDTRGHYDDPDLVPWKPTQTATRMHGFRVDRSFPALSHCSADGDMGDGSPGSGDNMGTINGHVTWDTTIVDLPTEWQCVLRSVSLPHRLGVFPAPESLFVDITPRRLQQFPVAIGVPYSYSVTDMGTGQIVQTGTVQPDADALLTLPQVRVTPNGARVLIGHPTTSVGDRNVVAPGLTLALDSNPVRGSTRLTLHWASSGAGRARVLDVAGRAVRLLHEGPATGTTTLTVDGRSLAPGLYWIEAVQGATRSTRRFAVIH